MTEREALKLALEALETCEWVDDGGNGHAEYNPRKVVAALRAVKEALKQPEQEPAAMRMPEVGDAVVCIEDDSLGTVTYLTAGGSPEIRFDDGSHGTYLLREFAELFRYTTPPQPEQEPRNISERWNIERDGDDLLVCFNDHEKSEGCRYERYVPAKAQPEQEPVAWETFALKFANGKGLSYEKPKNLPKYLACRPLIYAPVPTSDTSEKRVDEMAKQRHEQEPVIDKSAAIRIATSLGWEPKRKPLTIVELQKHWQVAKVLDMTDAEISFPDYVLITKDVEALHGIKEKNT